jgi:hypothetical protein
MKTKKMVTPPSANTSNSTKRGEKDPKRRKTNPTKEDLEEDEQPKKKQITKDDVLLRKMHIILASYLPNQTCSFIVQREGLIGIDIEE